MSICTLLQRVLKERTRKYLERVKNRWYTCFLNVVRLLLTSTTAILPAYETQFPLRSCQVFEYAVGIPEAMYDIIFRLPRRIYVGCGAYINNFRGFSMEAGYEADRRKEDSSCSFLEQEVRRLNNSRFFTHRIRRSQVLIRILTSSLRYALVSILTFLRYV